MKSPTDRGDEARRRRARAEHDRRWDDIEAALGTLADTGHDWDDDAAAWVQR